VAPRRGKLALLIPLDLKFNTRDKEKSLLLGIIS